MKEHWQTIQRVIRDQVDERTWEQFFRHLAIREYSDQYVVFELPDAFFVTWFENHYMNYLHEVIHEVTRRPLQVRMVVRDPMPRANDMMSLAPSPDRRSGSSLPEIDRSLPPNFQRMREHWQTIQQMIRSQVDERTWEQFFRHLSMRDYSSDQIVFELPDAFFVTWFENHYMNYLRDVLHEVTGQPFHIQLVARDKPAGTIATPPHSMVAPFGAPGHQERHAAPTSGFPTPPPMAFRASPPAPVAPSPFNGVGPLERAYPSTEQPRDFNPARAMHPSSPSSFSPSSGAVDAPAHSGYGVGRGGAAAAAPPPPRVEAASSSLDGLIIRAGLNPRYTFDQFIVGPSNQFPHAACQAIGERPAQSYNPMFLYGGVGLGKTHLLHAVGIEILKRHPNWRITYVSSENFMNALIDSLKSKNTHSFRTKYRNQCDVLLIDDIQFIAGKDSTQEEFFHTFNALYQARKQIVITSDKPPQDLPGLEERLRSRFGWGLIADIQPPEIETRIAIIKAKAELEEIALEGDVAMYLATHIRSNIRELEGAMIRLKAFSSLNSKPITVELAKTQLRDVIQERSQNITIDGIVKLTANFYNVKAKDILGPRRHRVVAHPRHVAMFLSRRHTAHSFLEIGKHFGGRDHTTVMSAVNKIQELAEKDSELTTELRSLEQALLR
ncbi:MAG: chromosomal replication initiator protein DnaA [Myxococcales bacterium]|nr:chromosomal replication initiator protein DnaA [Myxococcales bacterium]